MIDRLWQKLRVLSMSESDRELILGAFVRAHVAQSGHIRSIAWTVPLDSGCILEAVNEGC